MNPTEHGWKFVSEKYELKWYPGEEMPESKTDTIAIEIGHVYKEDGDEQYIESDDADDDWKIKFETNTTFTVLCLLCISIKFPYLDEININAYSCHLMHF